MDFWGTVVPFSWTASQRRVSGDPGPSVMDRCARQKTWLTQVTKAAERLIEEGFLLKEDGPRVIRRAQAIWEWVKHANNDMHPQGRCR